MRQAPPPPHPAATSCRPDRSGNSFPLTTCFFSRSAEPYLGNQLLSYGQNLYFSLRLDRGVRHPSINDVILEGAGLRVAASLGDLRSIVPCAQKISYSFRSENHVNTFLCDITQGLEGAAHLVTPHRSGSGIYLSCSEHRILSEGSLGAAVNRIQFFMSMTESENDLFGVSGFNLLL